MFRIFAGLFLIAAAVYVVAELTLDRSENENATVLRWATDPNPARKVQISTFARLNPGLDAVVDPGIGGDQTKLIVQCATGTGPDIVDMGVTSIPMLVQAGILLDLTPYAGDMDFSTSETYSAIAEAFKVNGRQYAFPCNIVANAVIYNKEIFDDHRVPYPRPGWTIEDFIKAGKGIRDNPSRSGQKHLPLANWYGMEVVQDFIAGLGGSYFSRDGLASRLDSPVVVRAFSLYRDLMFEHKVIPTAAEMSGMSAQGGWGSYGLTLFSSGRAAMIFCGRWYIVQVPNYPGLGTKLGAVELPGIDGRPSSVMAASRCAGINAKSKHWREALEFMRYLAGPEYNRLIAIDGDSLPPNPKFARSGKALANKSVRDSDFHQVFIDAMANARPVDMSPFMGFSLVYRWFWERVGEVENRLLSPDEACKKLAREVNQTIRRNLERQPALREEFERRTGKPYRSDWREAGT